jgi:midasin
MIGVNKEIQNEITLKQAIGSDGACWEFNLQDVLRCIRLSKHKSCSGRSFNPAQHFQALYLQRFRNPRDRVIIVAIFQQAFPYASKIHDPVLFLSLFKLAPHHSHTNLMVLSSKSLVLQQQLPPLEAAKACLDQGWLVILVGPNRSGKTSLAKLVAEQSGQPLEIIAMNVMIDTSDLLGNFKQIDNSQRPCDLMEAIVDLSEKVPYTVVANTPPEVMQSLCTL